MKPTGTHLVTGAGIGCCPVLSRPSEDRVVLLELPRHHGVLRVVGLGGRQQGLDTEQDRPEGHGGRPLVLQDVQTDGARHTGDVGVPDLGDEPHLHHPPVSLR